MNYKSQTVSAVVITHNNASTLEKTLSSLTWADELIVFDQGSTDETLAIARAFTGKVHYHPSKNLGIVKRDALSSGTCDWLLLIEPTEWVEDMLKHEIDGVLLHTPANLKGYTIPRPLKFQNHWDFSVPNPQLRLVRKKEWQVQSDWNATLSVNGDIAKLDRPLGYAPYLSIDSLFQGINQQSTLAAYEHLETYGPPTSPTGPFCILFKTKLAAWKHLLLNGALFKGLAAQTLGMAYTLSTFLKLIKIRALTQKV